MKGGAGTPIQRRIHSVPGFLFGIVLLALGSSAFGFTLTVVDSNNDPVTVGYRWLLEEDTTYLVRPGVPSTTSISVNIGTSYSIPVATGTDNDVARLDNSVILNPAKRYVLTVMPNQPPEGPNYTMSAAKIAAGQKSATVKVLFHPVPTAQISVLVFMDNAFINGAPDVPAEPGLPGFRILLFDQVGEMGQDAFANPLGTVYLQTCDAGGQNPGTGTDTCLDPDGAPVVETLGNGIYTDNTGNVIIKNLYPGKYGIRAVPTDNQLWVQTSTIEGTPGIDTWVAANEPSQFVEAGFFNVHVFIGFVHPSNDPNTGQPLDYGPKFICPETGCTTPGATVKGRVMSVHGNRPPLQPGLEIGRPVANAWVGLSDTLNGNAAVFAGPCDDNSEFTIPGVPPGTYTLTMWDFPLDQIIDYRTVVVTSDNAVNGNVLDYGEIPLFRWFGWFSGYVFADTNRNGFRDRNPATGEWLEASLPNQTVTLRQRDGSLYMFTTTDLNGYYEFNEVFPFYKWIVAERSGSDTGKRTGATIWVDNGGRLPVHFDPPVPVNFADPSTWYNDILTPQPQPENGGKGYRTVLGPTNTMATFLYMEDTTWIDWGKTSFGPGENGGISGNVFYQAMITEVNPAQTGQTWWATGIPRVKLNLYEDMDRNGVPDGPAIRTTFTQGWDDNFPTGCVDNVGRAQPFSPYVDCAEIIWTWQQVRPGVYDGIFSFDNLRSGTYIVEVIPPPAYELVKEEDQNIYFPGQTLTPGLLAPIPGLENPSTVWPCVGAMHHIPEYETMFPEQQVPTINFPYDNTLMTPLCDRKQVTLTDGLNASGGFALFTTVPRAGRLSGLVTNDLVFEFNPDQRAQGGQARAVVDAHLLQGLAGERDRPGLHRPVGPVRNHGSLDVHVRRAGSVGNPAGDNNGEPERPRAHPARRQRHGASRHRSVHGTDEDDHRPVLRPRLRPVRQQVGRLARKDHVYRHPDPAHRRVHAGPRETGLRASGRDAGDRAGERAVRRAVRPEGGDAAPHFGPDGGQRRLRPEGFRFRRGSGDRDARGHDHRTGALDQRDHRRQASGRRHDGPADGDAGG